MELRKGMEIKKSQLNASGSYELNLLGKENSLFVPLSIEQKESSYNFVYDLNDLVVLDEQKGLSILERISLLLASLHLYLVYQNYKIDLSPSNLYMDYGLNVKVASRDIYDKEDLHNEELFIADFLCLLGTLLNDKYSYEDFRKSGLDLLNKSKLTSKYVSLKSIHEVKEMLIQDYQKIRETQESTLTLVNKKKHQILKISTIVLGSLCVVLVGLVGYLTMHQNAYLQTVNKGYESYIASDYISTNEILVDVDIQRMSATSKYVIAVSYIRSDALTSTQKNNILAGVTLLSNERVLDYWVHLAKGEEEKAIDIAKQMDNEEYVVYGYMKLKEAVINDSTLSGADREARLKEIENYLKPYADQQKNDEGTGN